MIAISLYLIRGEIKDPHKIDSNQRSKGPKKIFLNIKTGNKLTSYTIEKNRFGFTCCIYTKVFFIFLEIDEKEVASVGFQFVVGNVFKKNGFVTLFSKPF